MLKECALRPSPALSPVATNVAAPANRRRRPTVTRRIDAGKLKRVGLITTATANALLAACEAQGVPRAPLLADAQIDAAALDADDGRMAEADLHRLWLMAAERTKDADLAIHAVEAMPKGAYKVIDFMMAHAPSLGTGIERAACYFPLIHTGVRLTTVQTSDECALDVGKNASPIAARPSAEYTLAAFARRVRESVDEPIRFLRIECAYAKPEDRRELDRFFACPLLFERSNNRLVLSREDWMRPTKRAEPGLFRILEQHAARLEAELPEAASLAAHVRRCIASQLRGGRPHARSVAHQLGLSERTLQRRLKEENTGFSALLDETRAELARVYLKEPGLNRTEVAYLLGFSDLSAFHRAYKRWTGAAPGAAPAL